MAPSGLLTDLYELNMAASYLQRGMGGEATFSLFIRQLPPTRGFLVAAGLEPCLEFLEGFGLSEEELDYLSRELGFEDPVLDALPGGRARHDPQVMPLVMVRVTDTAAALAARPAPAGLQGALRLEVDDAALPAGATAAAGTWRVEITDGAVRTVPLPGHEGRQADGQDDGLHNDAKDLPAVRLDVHAASLLLIGGRSLADAERLGLGVQADPAARTLLDALLAGPRPAVMDQF